MLYQHVSILAHPQESYLPYIWKPSHEPKFCWLNSEHEQKDLGNQNGHRSDTICYSSSAPWPAGDLLCWPTLTWQILALLSPGLFLSLFVITTSLASFQHTFLISCELGNSNYLYWLHFPFCWLFPWAIWSPFPSLSVGGLHYTWEFSPGLWGHQRHVVWCHREGSHFLKGLDLKVTVPSVRWPRVTSLEVITPHLLMDLE